MGCSYFKNEKTGAQGGNTVFFWYKISRQTNYKKSAFLTKQVSAVSFLKTLALLFLSSQFSSLGSLSLTSLS